MYIAIRGCVYVCMCDHHYYQEQHHQVHIMMIMVGVMLHVVSIATVCCSRKQLPVKSSTYLH